MTRRKAAVRTNHERWLVSYADFITLLFAFFVVLYASAQVDKRRVSRLAEAIEVAFQEMGAFSTAGQPAGASHRAPDESKAQVAPSGSLGIEQLRQELERSLAKEIERKEVSIRMGPDGLVLSLREIGFFDSGSAELRPQAQPTFERIAKVLSQKPYRLRVEGHTDNVPIHNGRFASNWELSTARATEVVRLLLVQYGFPAENLSASGYAEFHPLGDNATEEGRQMNRRIDVVVLTATKLQEQKP